MNPHARLLVGWLVRRRRSITIGAPFLLSVVMHTLCSKCNMKANKLHFLNINARERVGGEDIFKAKKGFTNIAMRNDVVGGCDRTRDLRI